jgi:coniferyl-aldehyde dehydrogenase
MKKAAENLVPVTLELGGKSPAIIGPGANIETAAMSIAYGKLANAGQTCIAPDYVLVPDEHAEAFLAAYRDAVATLYPEGIGSENYTSIISARHQNRLRDLVSDSEHNQSPWHSQIYSYRDPRHNRRHGRDAGRNIWAPITRRDLSQH